MAKQKDTITIPQQEYEIDTFVLEEMAENDELSPDVTNGNFEFKCIDPVNVVKKLMEVEKWSLLDLTQTGILDLKKEKK